MENPKKYGDYLYYFKYPELCYTEELGEPLGEFLDQTSRDLNIVTMQPVTSRGTTIGYWVVCKKKL